MKFLVEEELEDGKEENWRTQFLVKKKVEGGKEEKWRSNVKYSIERGIVRRGEKRKNKWNVVRSAE